MAAYSQSQIAGVLEDLFRAHSDKARDGADGTLLFDPPVLAVADAGDPWFTRFKEIIGPFHWTPQEALALSAPGAQARSVVCWCLPIAETVRRSNRDQTRFPSGPWARTRMAAEQFLPAMEHGLADWLASQGRPAAAPTYEQGNITGPQPSVGWSSCWSLRHIGFVAGLGTLGLSGGLITRRGIAHRLGAVVTEAVIEPTPREYGDDPFAWCLGSAVCGACIARCPVASVGQTPRQRDKEACLAHGRLIRQQGLALYGQEGRFGCGLCQTAVPCESRRPENQGP